MPPRYTVFVRLKILTLMVIVSPGVAVAFCGSTKTTGMSDGRVVAASILLWIVPLALAFPTLKIALDMPTSIMVRKNVRTSLLPIAYHSIDKRFNFYCFRKKLLEWKGHNGMHGGGIRTQVVSRKSSVLYF